MKHFLRSVLSLTEKDVRIEIRSRETLFATLLFVVLILVIFTFSFGTHPEIVQRVAPGIIWVAVAFSGTLALTHLMNREFQNRLHEGVLMTGISGPTYFFAKFLSSLLFMTLVELLLIPIFVMFFNFTVGSWLWNFLMILGLGTIGFAAVGTLFAALLSRLRLRELFLPMLFYPVIIPWFIVAVKATATLFRGETPDEVSFFLGFDIIFIAAAALLYEFALEDGS